MSKVDDFVRFSQEDADEYALILFGDDGPDPDGEWDLRMSTTTAVELFEALEKTLGRYIFEMRSARAAYDRASPAERAEVLGLGPEDEDAYEVTDPKHPRFLEMAEDLAAAHARDKP